MTDKNENILIPTATETHKLWISITEYESSKSNTGPLFAGGAPSGP